MNDEETPVGHKYSNGGYNIHGCARRSVMPQGPAGRMYGHELFYESRYLSNNFNCFRNLLKIASCIFKRNI